MGHSNRDVGGYRGRRTVTDILKGIAIFLAVAVVLAIAGVMYLQRYVVYTDEGAKLELPPFLQNLRQGDEPEEPEGSASLPGFGDVSITEDPVPPGPEPEPEPEIPGFALTLPVSDVVDGGAAARLEESGAGAVVLEVKNPVGQLVWRSDQQIAGWSKVNGTQAVSDALRQWNEGKMYTVAWVHCFRDDTVPYYNNNMALRWGSYNWRDELGMRWTSPAAERTQAYVAALCGELAALGFDEIVLEDFSFPTQGRLEQINRGDSYDSARFTAELEDFLTQVQEAAEPYGAKISLRVKADALENMELSGLSFDLLERFGDRLWMEREGWTILGSVSGAAIEEERIVEIVSQAEEDRVHFQAVVPQIDETWKRITPN